jgi:catecholate siderophore receptor
MPSTSTRSRPPLRALLFTGGAVLAALPGISFAQPAETGTSLGSMTVTDTPIDESESQSSYKISRSTSATRTDTPLIDVPQSISVVSVKQIEDQSANSIGDAIRYVAGVFASQGESNRDTLSFRGNSTTSSFFVDGIRDDVQTYRDLYNIERFEVFKGPSAMAFGRGTTGGLINRVTKVADGQQHLGARLEAGSDSHYRAQFDIGAPVSEVLSLRLTGVWQDSDSYRDGDYFKRWGFNPTATFAVDENTTVTLNFEHFKDKRIGDRGVSSYLGVPLRTPRSQFFGDPDNSPTFTNTDAGSFYIEHRFSDMVSIRSRTRYADYKKFYQNVFPGAVNTTTQTTPAGLPAGVYAPGTIVAINAYNNAQRRRNLINQTDFNAKFSTGSIEHTVLIGAEFGRQTTDNLRNSGFFPTATAPLGVSSIFVPITDTRISRPDVLFREISTDGDNYSIAKVAAGYVQDQIDLSPMFQVIVGIRYEHYNTKVHNRNPLLAAGTQRDFDVTDNLWSPRAGLIFKPIESASIYASYSRTYLPRGGDQLASLTPANQSYAPEKYENYEIGAKWDILPTFNVSGAVFQLDRDNVIALLDPNNPLTSLTGPIGRQRVKGVELSAQGEITEQLSIIASYTYSDAKFLDSLSGTVAAGNRVNHVPKNAAALWARFDPTKSIGAALGVTAQSKRFAATDNSVAMPGYARVDGALYYRINEQFDLQLNVENILNKRYFQYADSNTNITPGSPTAFKVALNARF